MARSRVDESIERVVIDEVAFPLGVYPVEPMHPVEGYSVGFEPNDGDDDSGDWEEWPDRYVFDIVLTAERLEALCRQLFAMLPGRVYPILDFIGHDAYREIDPYISYELIGLDRFTDALRRFRGFFFEDGMCGFGAMSEEPFLYVFVDEHKIVTVRAQPDLKERVEKVLDAFDLPQREEPAGADAAAHEHRTVLLTPDDRPDLLSGEEIVEILRDEWHLVLNVDAENNPDDDGNELGMTPWRCLVRCLTASPAASRYAEVFVLADCLNQAETMAEEAAAHLEDPSSDVWTDVLVVAADRVREQDLVTLLAPSGTGGGTATREGAGGAALPREPGVLAARWLR